MAELGSTGGNLDNILQYLLQRIEKIAEGVTGGGTTNFATLTLKINGSNEQYIPTGDSKLFDLDAVYATESWVKAQCYLTSVSWNDIDNKPTTLADYGVKNEINTLLTDYVNEDTFGTFKGNYDTLAAAVTAANGYTNTQIAALNIDQYATNSKLAAAISGANATAQEYAKTALAEAKSYADGKFVTLNTEQEITAAKKFVNMFDFFGTKSDGIYFYNHDSNGVLIGHYGSNYYGDDSYLQFRNGDWKGYVQFMKGIVGNVNVKNGGIEIFDTMPYIDFHYGNSTADFTSRIIESASGVLELFSSSYNPGTLKIGNAYITYDSKNNALMVSDGSGGAVNLVAMGDVAAFGGLGSGFDTLTDLTLTNKLKAYDIYCTRNLTVDGKLECWGAFYSEYMTVNDLYIDRSVIMSGNDIHLLLSDDAFIYYKDSESKITDISTDGITYVYITINGNKYKLSATKV